MIEVSDAILCILHLELRCSENKISNLLNEGFAHRKTPQLINDYIKSIEDIVNAGKIGLLSNQISGDSQLIAQKMDLQQTSH